METQFILEKYRGKSTRYTCPSCKQGHQFTRYIDTVSGVYLADNVGKCNRADKCGYHYPPKQFFESSSDGFIETKQNRTSTQSSLVVPAVEEVVVFYPEDIVKATMGHEVTNYFLQYLVGLFGQDKVKELLERYPVGTSKKWQGSTVFWLIDSFGNIRDGQIIQYNSVTGNRVKSNYPPVTWVHSEMPIGKTETCLFGEHLLSMEPEKAIAIVEAPKTALIASIFYPQFIWLATCGKHTNNLTSNRVAGVLEGRQVFLFPDLGFDKAAGKTTFEIWEAKAQVLRQRGVQVITVDVIEKAATPEERTEGLDLADYLIRHNLNDIRREEFKRELQEKLEKLSAVRQESIYALMDRFGLCPL